MAWIQSAQIDRLPASGVAASVVTNTTIGAIIPAGNADGSHTAELVKLSAQKKLQCRHFGLDEHCFATRYWSRHCFRARESESRSWGELHTIACGLCFKIAVGTVGTEKFVLNVIRQVLWSSN